MLKSLELPFTEGTRFVEFKNDVGILSFLTTEGTHWGTWTDKKLLILMNAHQWKIEEQNKMNSIEKCLSCGYEFLRLDSFCAVFCLIILQLPKKEKLFLYLPIHVFLLDTMMIWWSTIKKTKNWDVYQ